MIKNKKTSKRIYLSRFVLIVMTIIVLFLLFNSFSLLYKKTIVWKKVNELRLEKNKIEERKNKMDKEINDIENGVGIEKIMREKFNAVKNGEEVIILTPELNPPLPPPPPKTFWQKIKSLFSS